MEIVIKTLEYLDNLRLYPKIKTVSSPPKPVVRIDGRNLHMFCSNNYLNLATHPRVIKSNVEGTKNFGTGAGGSRLISGSTDLHKELEKVISELKNCEDSLVFSSGYLANLGVISAMAAPARSVAKELTMNMLYSLKNETVIFNDELNHASIIDACKIANVAHIRYKHVDMNDLREKLKKNRNKRKIIISDGVFSMDGNIAPLPEIVALAEEFQAITIIDDAHATGILGENGRGTAEYFNLKGKVDLEMGTLNKVFAGVGGFVSGNTDLCRFLRVASRSYIFSAAMPPGVASGLITAIKIFREEPGLRNRLLKNVEYFQSGLKKIGIHVKYYPTPIIPIIIGDESIAMSIAEELFKKGFFIPAIRWPAVPKGKARLRITVMTEHTTEQIDGLITELEELLEKYGVKNNPVHLKTLITHNV
ncbi:8-amino-7-oxononanoate synthase [Aestuariivivens sediminicola]|uniref:8-amino-7-oxononanoate synthase n=1 Tax=Aestuariivivens sediminicola TaxID=2913560 RepID=UPI001F56A22E|nr:8-amino-7-oxononanoate synthase [Aestuariivivens sediminicola]